MPARYTVTSALPYANGPIHFGHVAGAYLPADVYVRYKRLTGADVLYVCGTDEHGAPILVNAEKAGQSPADFAKHWHEEIKRSFDRLDIRFDNFSRTSRPIHRETTHWFFNDLLENGYITSKVEDQLYCEFDKMGLPDRYVTGTCPSCKFEQARGDECPKCGHSYEATDLIDPKCNTCGKPAGKKPAKHWYLDLPKLGDKLSAYHEERFPNWRPNVIGEVKKFTDGLRERNITRDLSWGIDVPLEEAKDKVFYVWFDAPIGYISSTREWAKEQGQDDDAWKTWWQDPETQLVHFIGKDNIAFHAVIFPAMLAGQSASYVLPDVPANEFLNLEGRKFSTSGGWFITISDVVKRHPADAIRWTLTRGAPETKDAEFTWKDFQTRVNTELLGTFGNFASRVLKFVQAKFDGVIPAAQAELGEPETTALAALATGVEEVGAALEGYSSRTAAERLLQVGYAANKLIEETQPFKTIKDDPARAATTINVACRILEGLAILLAPFVPATAKRLWIQVGLNHADLPTNVTWAQAATPSDPAGRKIGKLKHLFKKVEDADVEREVAALHKSAGEGGEAAGGAKQGKQDKQKKAKKPKPTFEPKASIDYEEFTNLDIRIATVKACEPVPKADKLLKLTLSIGDEERTVVSGIKAWYAPEDLVGRQVIYLANLAPRKLRGIVSQGMVLAGNDVGNVAVLLQAEKPLPDGAKVS